MNALIVGADKVDTIRAEITRIAPQLGLSGEADHWPGRKVGDAKRDLPRDVNLVVIVCDRTSHMLMRHVRTQADRRKIPVVFCRHSATELRERLDSLPARDRLN